MHRRWILLVAMAVACGPLAAFAPAADRDPPAIEFALVDLEGKSHTAAVWTGKPAVVLFFVNTECPVANYYAAEMSRLAKLYSERGVLVLGVYPDPVLTADVAKQHAAEYQLAFPLLLDPKQSLSRQAGARVTPEAIVLTATGKVLYRGRIDDRYATNGKRRSEPRARELVDALEAILAGKEPAVAETAAFGCPLPKVREE